MTPKLFPRMTHKGIYSVSSSTFVPALFLTVRLTVRLLRGTGDLRVMMMHRHRHNQNDGTKQRADCDKDDGEHRLPYREAADSGRRALRVRAYVVRYRWYGAITSVATVVFLKHGILSELDIVRVTESVIFAIHRAREMLSHNKKCKSICAPRSGQVR